jgi:hypothetical protein
MARAPPCNNEHRTVPSRGDAKCSITTARFRLLRASPCRPPCKAEPRPPRPLPDAVSAHSRAHVPTKADHAETRSAHSDQPSPSAERAHCALADARLRLEQQHERMWHASARALIRLSTPYPRPTRHALADVVPGEEEQQQVREDEVGVRALRRERRRLGALAVELHPQAHCMARRGVTGGACSSCMFPCMAMPPVAALGLRNNGSSGVVLWQLALASHRARWRVLCTRAVRASRRHTPAHRAGEAGSRTIAPQLRMLDAARAARRGAHLTASRRRGRPRAPRGTR